MSSFVFTLTLPPVFNTPDMDNLQYTPINGLFYLETYGCQMNVADSELVTSIMIENGYQPTDDYTQANILFVNTCSIRENAEQRVFGRLDIYRLEKKKRPGVLIGVLGCMAERLKNKLFEHDHTIDMVIGPDAYRDLPNLVTQAGTGQQAINVLLSREETYADINPVRVSHNRISAFISIMRGCNNMCAFCIVPFTRGRERSRNPESILSEAQKLRSEGYKEITLLGQNVDKYDWNNGVTHFAGLLAEVAKQCPDMRIRFSTSYPQDMTDEVLHTIAAHNNICRHIHLPVQSGSTTMLEKMRRGYTRQWYMNRIEAIRSIIPDCAISTDIIAGFCGENDQQHQDTISLMKEVRFDFAYMFKYSERPNTYAQRSYPDDVPDVVKTNRLNEIIALQNQLSLESHTADIGKTMEVLVEGRSKKSEAHFFGRNSQNKVVVFPRGESQIGALVHVRIESCTSATLKGTLI